MRLAYATVLISGLLASTGCSTSFWYTQVQTAQYDQCNKLTHPEDRRRCTAETYPDPDKYAKERAKTRN